MKRTYFLLAALLFAPAFQWQAAAQQAPTKRWDYRYGGIYDDNCRQVVAMPNGDFVLVGITESPVSDEVTQPGDPLNPFSQDIWVVRVDANGVKLWDRRYGGVFDTSVASAFANPDGSIVLAGHVQGGIGRDVTQPNRTFFSNASDYWVVKIDGNGTKLWDRRYGGDDNELLRMAIRTRDGGMVLAGIRSCLS